MKAPINPAHIPDQLAAAVKLLDRAIEMFFAGDDLLFVLAMANPAHVTLHDIAYERALAGNVISQVSAKIIRDGARVADGSPVTKISDVIAVLRRDANGLKHPAEKPGVQLGSVNATLTVACVDAVSLAVATPAQLTFLMWRLAQDPDQPDHVRGFVGEMFPGIAAMSFDEALSAGKAALEGDQTMERMMELSPLIVGSDGSGGV